MKKMFKRVFVLAVVMVVVVLSWKPIVLWLHLTQSSITHPQELSAAQLFCDRILTNDTPSAEWILSLDDRFPIIDKTNYFYSLKVHFTECGTTLADIDHARIWVFYETPTNAIAEFHYQKSKPYFSVYFNKVGPDGWKLRATFPLNNCTFDPDVTEDGVVDHKDVEFVRKTRK